MDDTDDRSPAAGVELDPERFRELGHRAVDEMARFFQGLDDLPVFPGMTPAEVEALFDEPLPETGQDPDAVLDAWAGKILPAASHNTSPRYFGFVMGSGTRMGL